MTYKDIIVQIGSPKEGSVVKVLGVDFVVGEKGLSTYNKIKVKASPAVLKNYRASRGIKVAAKGKEVK